MTNADRCDRCGAQAYLDVAFATGSLMFCAHHFEVYRDKFPKDFLILEDTRKLLTAR